MTTIAYRKGILAADTLATGESAIFSHQAQKALQTEWGVVAGCGVYHELREFLEWCAKSKQLARSRTTVRAPVFQEMSAILIYARDPMTVWVMEGGGFFYPEKLLKTRPFIAIGTGMVAAMAAMYAGRSARDAVRIASKLDTRTGGDVIEYKL